MCNACLLFKFSPIHFCCKYCFNGKKLRQSWPIGNVNFRNSNLFYGSTLFAFFTFQIKLTAKMNGFTRKLLKFWIIEMLNQSFSEFLFCLRKLLKSFGLESRIFQCILVKSPNFSIFLILFKGNSNLLDICFTEHIDKCPDIRKILHPTIHHTDTFKVDFIAYTFVHLIWNTL